MEWTLKDDRPIWLQLYEQLERRIVSGTYPPGSRLPSVRELAAEAGVNPNTMQRALQQLESAGLAETNRTAGRTVTDSITVIESVRSRMAKKLVDEYITAAAELGYSRQEATALLTEPGGTIRYVIEEKGGEDHE